MVLLTVLPKYLSSSSSGTGSGGAFWGAKWPRRENEYTLLLLAELKNEGSYTTTPPRDFEVRYLIKRRDNFTVRCEVVTEMLLNIQSLLGRFAVANDKKVTDVSNDNTAVILRVG
jgi:hypothetical protein